MRKFFLVYSFRFFCIASRSLEEMLSFCTIQFHNKLRRRKQGRTGVRLHRTPVLPFGEDYYAAAEALPRLLDRYW